jgi:hypothetical protein
MVEFSTAAATAKLWTATATISNLTMVGNEGESKFGQNSAAFQVTIYFMRFSMGGIVAPDRIVFD